MAEHRGEKPVVHTKKHLARLERERRQVRLILITFIVIMVSVAGLATYAILYDYVTPVARVGDATITVREFKTRVMVYRENLLNTYQQYYIYQQYGIDMNTQLSQLEAQLNDNFTLGQEVLDGMIEEELIRQEAAKRGITVTDEELEDRIREAKQFFPDGSPTPSVTPTDITLPTESSAVLKYLTPTSAFTATPEITATLESTATPEITLTAEGTPGTTNTPLPTATLEPTATTTATLIPTATLSGSPTPEPTATPYTLEGYQELYQSDVEHFTKYGLSEQQFRDLYKADLLRRKLFDEITADLPRSELQLRARHILVQSDVEANSIIESLKQGADFGEIAREKSLDTGTGAQGGDVEWFGHGIMQPAFEEAAYALEIGEISAPVQTVYGFHVIQVIDKAERPLDAEQYEQAKNRAFDDFITSLRETYKITTYEDVWTKVVPNDPSFASLATEAARTQGAQ